VLTGSRSNRRCLGCGDEIEKGCKKREGEGGTAPNIAGDVVATQIHLAGEMLKLMFMKVLMHCLQRYHPNGWMADVCPVEITKKIMQNLSIADLMLYGATSSVNYKIMHEALAARFVDALKPFRLCPNDFIHILHRHWAIVASSFALYIFDPSGVWFLKDLDIYVPNHRVKHVVKRLRAHGYIPIRAVRKASSRSSYDQPIVSVTTLTNGDRSIDVVESTMRSSISPIFQFHLTAVMNYISSTGFFSAYPTLMSAQRSLYNHVHYKGNTPTQALLSCYTKYRMRGYELHASSKEWADAEGKTHRCQHSFDCPHRIHTLYDPGCLFVGWHTKVSRLQAEETQPQRRCFDNRQAPVWCLGGDSCDGEREPIRPFMTMKGAESLFDGVTEDESFGSSG